MGLEAYQFEHYPVFFGREDEVSEVSLLLRRRARNGCAFVLISGASGSGKSSLARAGVVPSIMEFEVDERVARWERLVVAPGEIAEDLIRGMAERLAGVFPTLSESAGGLDSLADLIRDDPEVGFARLVLDALSGAGEEGKPIRLVFLIDQLEELFTDARISTEDANLFGRALEILAKCGAVWVLATIRSDYAYRCQEVPSLLRLREGDGEFDLLPPAADAIARIIREPARLAGARYEEKDGMALSDILLREATERRELLPFLSLVLEQLWEDKSPENVLTFASWEQELGGNLPDTVANYAERVFNSLSLSAQESMAEVWSRLISLGGNNATQPVRLYPRLGEFSAKPEWVEFVNVFIGARLFTASGDTEDATVSIVHETLVSSWWRASEWVAANIEALRMASNVASYRDRWESSDQDKSLLLPPGLPLEEGRSVIAGARNLLDTGTADFISDSVSFHENRERRRRRIRTAAIVTLASLTVFAVAGFMFALKREREAKIARDAADEVIHVMLYDLRDELEERGMSSLLERINKTATDYFETFPSDSMRSADYKEQVVALTNSARNLLSMGKPDEALEKSEQAIKIMEDLIEEEPENEEYVRYYGISHEKMGDIKMATDGPGAAMEHFLELNKTMKRIHEGNPSGENVWDLSTSYTRLGDTKMALGHAEDALAFYKQGEQLSRELYEQRSHPGNRANNMRGLSICVRKLGEAEQARGRLAEALEHFEEFHDFALELHSIEPEARQIYDLATSHSRLGNLRLELGEPADAEVNFQSSLALTKELYQQEPDAHNARALSACHSMLGDLAVAKDGDKAPTGREQYHKAQILNTKLYNDEPSFRNALELAIGHWKLGWSTPVEEMETALSHFTSGFELLRGLEDSENPTVEMLMPKFEEIIADLEEKIGKE